LFPVTCVGLMLDLIWFTQKRQPQCDPALYYPPIPALEQTARAKSGRVIGNGCLPPNLASMAGLRDVRGYDATDPANFVELLTSAPLDRNNSPSYAITQNFVPKITFFPNGEIQLPPVLDMLGVRYVIFRGQPYTNARPLFTSFDYYVVENTIALSRVFIPRRVKVVPDHDERLRELESPNFNPGETAFVETPVELPQECRGEAEIREEIPTRVRIEARMQTAGLVVLTDLWNKGWRAYLDGQNVPVLRANHAVRGVVVPHGTHSLEFRYQPASFTWGVCAASLSGIALVMWVGFAWRQIKTKSIAK
jgi:Bacterial membrane protein YfhO